MDSQLEKIVLQGTWSRVEDPSIGKEMKDDAVGERTQYVFTCPYCDREYKTEKTYRVTDNYVTDSIKINIFFRISEFFWDTLGEIPVVGDYLRRRADDKLDAIEDGIENRKDRKTLLKAFEEIRHNFAKCTQCGRYTCKECMVDGICGFCRDGAVTRDGASVGKSQASSELSAEYQKQIDDLEKMYAEMIKQNPAQKEMFEKQLEDQKRQILAARKTASEVMSRNDDEDEDW